MKIYSKTWESHIPIPIEEAWAYFSRPENLNELTPDDMDFEIVTDVSGIEMYEGMLIQYRVAPLLNIKLNWVTEITKIDHLNYFIDEQRFGPYALWHHEHHFESTDYGTRMIDKLQYGLPFGFLGTLMHKPLVGKRVEEIFEYRAEKLKTLFPERKKVLV
ncbi:MAG: SRPBCC family protein [Bacteroidota bacterium]